MPSLIDFYFSKKKLKVSESGADEIADANLTCKHKNAREQLKSPGVF